MADLRKNGNTSNLMRFLLLNSSTGAPLTGLAFGSSGLIISTVADNEASATAYTQAGSTIETITTLGTFAAPTATKCRFKEVDATNHPGLYEFQFADARFAVSNARRLVITVSGAASLLATSYEVQLIAADVYDAAGLGLTRLDAAVTTRLAPTTAGRTLDVAATGEAGLDFDNIHDASGAHTLTNITVPVATSAGSVSGNVGGNVVGSVASVTADVGITQAGADKVWGSAARTLTSFGTLVADIWANASRTLTAISDSSGITTLLSRLTSGRATNLDNLDAAVSSRLATAGYTTPPTAVQNRAEMDSNSTKLANLDATVSSRLATSGYTAPPSASAIADQVWDEALSGHLTAGTTGAALNGASAPTAAAVADAVWDEATAGHVAAGSTGLALSAAGSGGVTVYGEDGAIDFTYTVYQSDGVTPLPNCEVWISSDLAGTNRSASKATDSVGRVTFALDAGTVYVWRRHSSWVFANPDTETVS